MRTYGRRLLGTLALAAGLTGCDSATTPPEGSVFVIEVVDGERFRLLLTDPQVVQEARAFLESGAHPVVNGELARGDGGFNRGYPWHLKPETVEFADAAIEVCDGRPSEIQKDLDYWFNTVRRYCPWGVTVVAEE